MRFCGFMRLWRHFQLLWPQCQMLCEVFGASGSGVDVHRGFRLLVCALGCSVESGSSGSGRVVFVNPWWG